LCRQKHQQRTRESSFMNSIRSWSRMNRGISSFAMMYCGQFEKVDRHSS
jgi:hypothetical protein